MVDHLRTLAAVAAGELTSGRVRSLAGLAMALLAANLGILALIASTEAKRRGRGIAATIIGFVAMSASVFHIATAPGAIGTGSGILGAIVALVIAVVGTGLGALAIVRTRRTT